MEIHRESTVATKAAGSLRVVMITMVLLIMLGFVHAADSNHVRMSIVSKIDEELGVYWIDTLRDGVLVRQAGEPMPARGMLNLDSKHGSSFLVVEEKHAKEFTHFESSIWDPKIMTFFSVGEYDLEAFIDRNPSGVLTAKLESALTRTSDFLQAVTDGCEGPSANRPYFAEERAPGEIPLDLLECLTAAISDDLGKKESEAAFSRKMLEQVGDRTRKYTCADPLMETTKNSLRSFAWQDPEEGATYNSEVFLDQPAAKIYLVDDFASEGECKMLISKARRNLQDATVRIIRDTTVLPSAWRAKFGVVDPSSSSKLSALYRRGYNFANDVTGYNMTLQGQEGFGVAKYRNGDEYPPHCDGDCTGAEYIPGGRVASMLVFCKQAEVGGGTTFSSSDVFIKGKDGQAVFYSYLGPDGRTDIGRTRNSACPVVEGTKWVASMWMRLGVTAERNWQHYEPSGREALPAGRQQTRRIE